MNFKKIKRNFRRDAKAISPVIATLLMIAIAVVASLVAYAWVMGYMGFTTNKTGKAIQIQSIAYSGTGSTFTIYVQNVGDSPVQFAASNSIFINGAVATGALTPSPLNNGATAQASIIATGLTAGVQSITFKVTTTDGTFTQATQQFTIG